MCPNVEMWLCIECGLCICVRRQVVYKSSLAALLVHFKPTVPTAQTPTASPTANQPPTAVSPPPRRSGAPTASGIDAH